MNKKERLYGCLRVRYIETDNIKLNDLHACEYMHSLKFQKLESNELFI